MLTLRDVDAGYGHARVLRNVSFDVAPGAVVALLGANGAGKTTTLRVASGLITPVSGYVYLDGIDVTHLAPHRRTQLGLCLIPEGRGVYPSLTVRENLQLHIPPWKRSKDVGPAIQRFPVLADRLNQVAGSLSGGEQQMLALSRVYLAEPRFVLLDELSSGLSPLIVRSIFTSLSELVAEGISLLVVEQYVSLALAMADTAILMTRGRIEWTGPAKELDEAALLESYLGTGDS